MPQSRYELKDILGKGGMGAVYRAYDNETRRDVTLKTLLDVADRTMLDLFYRECHVLATLNHPNIVDIYDVGEMEFDGGMRPYFVMPLLPGQTLDKLIAGASHRLTVDRVVEILSQSARGLHAAHERGLVHRDVKPSNIFVMEDDSVKIIDFGVAHLADSRTNTTLKGTLHYMAPEQLQMQKPTALSDLFSLAVVAYQTLARRRPFEGATMDETIQAILHRVPPPVSELNPNVSRAIGQVIHKAMAKQPYHRFANAREFGDNLQRALRGDPIDVFDDTKILPRLMRARRAMESGEFDFANEVLAGLEAEGYLHTEMAALRRQVDDAIRLRAIKQRLDTARRFMEEEEYQLALTKVQELIQIDPGNADAQKLKAEIETRRSTEQVVKWMRLAEQHADNHAYSHARQALENVLQLRPDDVEARRLLNTVMVREQDYVRFRREKEQVYQAAMEAWQRGEVSAALSDMERVIDLDKKAPETSAPERGAAYQKFYNQVRSEHDTLQNSYQDARRLMNERNFKQALAVCDDALVKHPGHALFAALRVDIEELERQDLSAFIAKVDREVEQEPDLERRISLLTRALDQRPGEGHFQRALQLTTSKRDLVNSIVGKARGYEEREQYQEALAQWEMLRTIYAIYPGLEFEFDRLRKRREQQSRSEAKAQWIRKIEQALGDGDFNGALGVTQRALEEFPGDSELQSLEQLARQGLDKLGEAQKLLEQGKSQCESGEIDAGLETLRRARALDDTSAPIRAALLGILLKQARSLNDSDWEKADRLTREALDLEPGNPMANSLRAMFEDRKRTEFVDRCVTAARQHQAADRLDQAIAEVSQGLSAYPSESRLLQLKASLERSQTELNRTRSRRDALNTVKDLERRAAQANNVTQIRELFEQTQAIAGQHAGDRDFEAILGYLRKRLDEATVVAVPSTPPPQATHPPPSKPVTPPPPPKAATPEPAPKAVTPTPAPAARQEAVRKPPPPPAASTGSGKMIAIAAGLAAVGIGAFLALRSGRSGLDAVELKTNPPGALLQVDGSDVGASPRQHQLAPGEHMVVAKLDGYAAAQQKVIVAAGASCCDVLVLAPLPTVARVTTDLADPTASLDSGPPTALSAGQVHDMPGLPDGSHRLALAWKEGSFELGLTSSAGRAPEFAPPATIPARTTVYVLSSVGRKGRFWASNAPVKLSLDGGQSVREVPAAGLDLEDLPAGPRDLTIESGSGKRLESLPAVDGPSLAVLAFVDRPAQPKGSILISVNEAEFEVTVDGVRAGKRSAGAGQFLIPFLNVGKRRVQVTKAGYKAEPDSVVVDVADGQTAKVPAIRLSPLGPSRWTIRNSTPGAQIVLVNGGRLLGVLDGQGAFTGSDLPDGNHAIEIRKKGYLPRQGTIAMVAGRTSELVSEPLEVMGGTFHFQQVEPKGLVSLTIQQTSGDVKYDGPNPIRPLPPSLKLPAGTYNLTFSASGMDSETINVTSKDYPLTPAVKLRKK